jgi:hypothetical protein
MATLITPGGISYTVMHDQGITESIDPESGPQAQARLRCSWTDHYAFMQEWIGTSKKVGSAIVRSYPLAYPPAPNLRARAIAGVELLGKPTTNVPSGWLVASDVIVTVHFGILLYGGQQSQGGATGQPYTTVTFGVSGEFLTLPESTYRFPDGTPTNSPVGRVIPQIQINVRRYQVPYLPVAEMVALAGSVNSTPTQIGNYTFAPGYLLFSGGPSDFTMDSLGNVTNQVDYTFMYRPIPWNYYLHPNRTTGFALITDGNGNPVYGSGDFNTLP